MIPVLKHNHFTPVFGKHRSQDEILKNKQYLHQKIQQINSSGEVLDVNIKMFGSHLPQY